MVAQANKTVSRNTTNKKKTVPLYTNKPCNTKFTLNYVRDTQLEFLAHEYETVPFDIKLNKMSAHE